MPGYGRFSNEQSLHKTLNFQGFQTMHLSLQTSMIPIAGQMIHRTNHVIDGKTIEPHKRYVWPSVLRQPAHQQAVPKCHAPLPGWLPVLRQSAHHFGGLKGCQSSGIVSASLLSGVLPKALKLGAQAFNHGSSALQGFSMKTVPSGKAHWPNWLVKLTPTGPACWYPPLRSGAPYLGR